MSDSNYIDKKIEEIKEQCKQNISDIEVVNSGFANVLENELGSEIVETLKENKNYYTNVLMQIENHNETDNTVNETIVDESIDDNEVVNQNEDEVKENNVINNKDKSKLSIFFERLFKVL